MTYETVRSKYLPNLFMADFSLDQNKALADFANKLKSESVEVTQETKVEEAPVAEIEKPEAKVEAPEEETPEIEAPKPEVERVEEITWDADLEIEQKVQTPTYDFKSLGSALELGEVQSESDLIAKISEIKTKAKQLEEKPFEGIPDDLKTFVEVARTSGEEEAKAFLANQLIDYSKVDPLQLFEDEFYRDAAKNPKYHKDGKIDWESIDAAYDGLPDALKEFQGTQLQYAKQQLQLQKRQEIVAKNEARRNNAERSLSEASRNLNEILPFDKYGIKFEPKHTTHIYEGVVNSKLTKKHLGMTYDALVKSGADMKAIAATVAKAEYTEQMLKFKSNNSKVEAKKELLEKTQNAVLKSPGSIVEPSSEAAKPKTPKQLMEEYKARLNSPGRL